MLKRMLRRGSTGDYTPKRLGRRAFRKVKSMIFSAVVLIIVLIYFMLNR